MNATSRLCIMHTSPYRGGHPLTPGHGSDGEGCELLPSYLSIRTTGGNRNVADHRLS